MITIRLNFAMFQLFGLAGLFSVYTVHGGKIDKITAFYDNGRGVPGYVFKLIDDVNEVDFLVICPSSHKVDDIS